MRTFLFPAGLVLAMLAALASAGCGGEKAARPAEAGPAASGQTASGSQALNFSYAPKALEITFVSDPFLNEREGAASALPVCVYQLKEQESFRSLAGSAPGLARLLECADFDPPSVVGFQRVMVQPGRDVAVTLDRGEKARFVAVVFGFHDLDPATASRIYEIPVSSDTSGWLWWKETTWQPAKLSRKIFLGRSGVQRQ